MYYTNTKSIAILLAVYNGEKYLAEQLDSLITQTNQDWTLYIRDDASNDGTLDIINDYCNRYLNFILLKDYLGNLGCRNNFFKLLEVINSEYYMFCDADDVWFPNKIEISLQRIKELEPLYPNTPLLVHTDCSICDANMNLMVESYWKSENLNPDDVLNFNELAICTCIGGSTMFFNKDVKITVLPLEQNLMLYDSWIALQVIRKGIISTIHTPTKKYRQHGNNICGVSTGKKFSILQKLFNSIKANKNHYLLLKSIGYGSVLKYIYYKIRVQYKIRVKNTLYNTPQI
jgi:rhamnosyltransferase